MSVAFAEHLKARACVLTMDSIGDCLMIGIDRASTVTICGDRPWKCLYVDLAWERVVVQCDVVGQGVVFEGRCHRGHVPKGEVACLCVCARAICRCGKQGD